MKLLLLADGYSTAVLHYRWCSRDVTCSNPVKVEPIELPTYRFEQLCVNSTLATTASGSYSRLHVIFVLDRESGFYFLQIFLPAALVVVISWVTFWISRDSPPSRTVIGVMTVLAETHLMTGTGRRLPPVSYVKAVDIYLGFCYLLVVLTLIEYACVAYSKKKNEDRIRKTSKIDTKHSPAIQQPDLLQDARLAKCTCDEAPPTASVLAVVREPFRFCVRHSHIDMASRVLFPTSFLVFNLLFWIILLHKAGRLRFSDVSADRCG